MSDNWVVQHLVNALNTWNEKMEKYGACHVFAAGDPIKTNNRSRN